MLMWHIKALVFFVQKLIARLKLQTERQKDGMTGWPNDTLADRTKTICCPIFYLGGIKRVRFAVKISIPKKKNLSMSSKRFNECIMNTINWVVDKAFKEIISLSKSIIIFKFFKQEEKSESCKIWFPDFFSKFVDLVPNLTHFEFFSKCIIFQTAM